MSTKQANKTQINEGMPWAGIKIPSRYDLTDKGVYREEPPEKPGGEPTDIYISGPIWVQSFEINDRGQWNVNLEFIDRIGRLQTHSLALSCIYGSATALATELGGLGLRLARSEVSSLSVYLSSFTSPVAEREQKKAKMRRLLTTSESSYLKMRIVFRTATHSQSGLALVIGYGMPTSGE